MRDGRGDAGSAGPYVGPPASDGGSYRPVRLGDFLVDKGYVTPEQLEEALNNNGNGVSVGQVLLHRGFLTEESLAEALAAMARIPFRELRLSEVENAAVQAVPRELPAKHRLMPLRIRNGTLLVACADPFDILAVDELERRTKLRIDQICVTESDVRAAVDHFYGGAGLLEQLVADTVERQEADRRQARQGVMIVAQAASPDSEPVVQLVDELINLGLQRRATDVHIEPEDQAVRVRLRIDGLLQQGPMLPKRIQESLISRIKVIAALDIAEQRLPQEGHITYVSMGREIDLRVSCFPTVFGEKVALRLLDRTRLFRGLEDLGLEGGTLRKLRDSLQHTKGIVLLTGPTGSGKTTTLYTMLSSLDTLSNNIVTLEDPVEYRIPQIRQSQINRKAKFTFGTGLRSILRQDPDVIMVGEIRDPETAGLAMRAALTGILVFSTLHTNEAAGTFPRLIDMEMEAYLIGSTMIASVAERLVRKVCPHCAIPIEPQRELLVVLGLEDESLDGEWRRGAGCSRCSDTGYAGRTGIFEILMVNDRIRELIQMRSDSQTIRRAAIENDMETLLQHGLTRARRGETTLEELVRVARE